MRSRNRSGFSLVELMVVVVIIGLIGGVAVVSWQSLVPNQRFNSAVRNLSEVLHHARSEAISRSREFQIHYDLEAEAYRIRTPYRLEGGGFARYDDEPRLWISETSLLDAGIAIAQVDVDGVSYTDGTVYVPFDALGGSAAHRVVLTQELFDRTFTIEVLPLTGEIRFFDGYFEREEALEEDFR